MLTLNTVFPVHANSVGAGKNGVDATKYTELNLSGLIMSCEHYVSHSGAVLLETAASLSDLLLQLQSPPSISVRLTTGAPQCLIGA